MNDTWEWTGTTWVNVTPAGAKPSPRVDAALAYDSARGRTVLFGGSNMSNQPLADTWEWNGTTWTQVATVGPPPRLRGSLTYDPLRQVTVLFGGTNNSSFLGDTWEWNGAVWAQRQVAGPSARSTAGFVANGLCGNALLYGGEGGGLHADTWGYDGTAWTQLATAGPAPRDLPAMTYDGDRNRAVLFGGLSQGTILGETWEWVSPCIDEAAPLDGNGNVVLPPDLDPNQPPVFEDVEQNLGDVQNLYPGAAAGDLDTWYPQMTCSPSLGGSVPPAAANPDLAGQLAAAGIAATPQDVATTLASLESQIAQQAEQEPDPLQMAGSVVQGLTAQPAIPHCAETGCGYVFGGRDIVFVHGLRLDPLYDKIFGLDPGARTTWPQDKSAFYGSGYWKRGAERYWADHIKRFFTDRGLRNRYLIVAYPSTQRLGIGVQAVLAQIADAMQSGIGVVDPTGRNDVTKFGTPSFVVVSHSTGGLVTDVAMAAAASIPRLGAGFIPPACKAHVAMDAVFSGSRLATAAVALSSYVSLTHPPPAWLCPLANLGVKFLNQVGSNNPTLSCPLDYLAIANSILVDLVPLVAQKKWGGYVAATPVRTLTVAGGHPSFQAPFKNVLNLGFDDGVANVESQVGNPNGAQFWPSGYKPIKPGALARVFDMGVARTEPARAIGYYVDQVVDRLLNPLSVQGMVAAGATPYVSPSGMVQPVDAIFLGGNFDPLARYPNHFSFLLSAADHFEGSTGPFPHGADYRPTVAERNAEETRVLTNPAVYLPYPMLYPGDDGPLLTRAQVPTVEEIVKGRDVQLKFRHRKYGKRWWIWKRRYHLVAGWEGKDQMDYVYGTVLTQSIPACPPPSAASDCNGNGIADVCDVANGSSRDCNADNVPDECETSLTLAPAFNQQPAAQSLHAGVRRAVEDDERDAFARRLAAGVCHQHVVGGGVGGSKRANGEDGGRRTVDVAAVNERHAVLAPLVGNRADAQDVDGEGAFGLTAFESNGGLVDAVVPVANGPQLNAGTTYALVLEAVDGRLLDEPGAADAGENGRTPKRRGRI